MVGRRRARVGPVRRRQRLPRRLARRHERRRGARPRRMTRTSLTGSASSGSPAACRGALSPPPGRRVSPARRLRLAPASNSALAGSADERRRRRHETPSAHPRAAQPSPGGHSSRSTDSSTWPCQRPPRHCARRTRPSSVKPAGALVSRNHGRSARAVAHPLGASVPYRSENDFGPLDVGSGKERESGPSTTAFATVDREARRRAPVEVVIEWNTQLPGVDWSRWPGRCAGLSGGQPQRYDSTSEKRRMYPRGSASMVSRREGDPSAAELERRGCAIHAEDRASRVLVAAGAAGDRDRHVARVVIRGRSTGDDRGRS